MVDDGIATGATVRVACEVVRQRGASRIVVATPVAPAGWTDGDESVSLLTPADFRAVGQWYDRFDQTTDAEVVDALG